MKYIVEVSDSKTKFVEEFFRSVSFIKKAKPVAANEITNPDILKSIETYETRKVKPTQISLAELKKLIHA